MPRAYNERERAEIKRRLIKTAEELFTRFGLKKTSIDELVQIAGIGKGSFYLFFESKEALFFEVQKEIESDIKNNLSAELRERENDPGAMVRRFFQIVLDVLETHPFLSIVTEPGVMDQLMLHIPPDQLMKHRVEQEAFYKKMFKGWIRKELIKNVSANTLMSVVTAIFVLHQQKALLGEEFLPMVSFLVNSVCYRIVPIKRL